VALNTLLLGKLESVSGQGRLSGGLAGLSLFAHHPLLGVGWGSNRSFDLLTNILSNLGVVGFGLLVWAHLAAIVPSFRTSRAGDGPEADLRQAALLEAPALALIVLLIAKALAEPELTYLDHVVLLGLLASSLRWRPATRAAREAASE
jgi:hypothetical protein